MTDPGALRAVIGAGLYLTLLGLMSLGIGVLVRHSAGALAVLFGLLLLLPSLTEALPARMADAVNPYLPSYAGQAIFHTVEDTHLLPPGKGSSCSAATPRSPWWPRSPSSVDAIPESPPPHPDQQLLSLLVVHAVERRRRATPPHSGKVPVLSHPLTTVSSNRVLNATGVLGAFIGAISRDVPAGRAAPATRALLHIAGLPCATSAADTAHLSVTAIKGRRRTTGPSPGDQTSYRRGAAALTALRRDRAQ